MAEGGGPRSAVAVFGHYGQLNLGDEAIIAACIHGVRQQLPSARVLGFSLDPLDTRRRHDVQSAAIRVGDWRNEDARPTDALPPPTSTAVGFLRRIPGLRRAASLARAGRDILLRVLREIASVPGVWRSLAGVRTLIIAGSNQMMDHFGGAWGFPYTLLKWAILCRARGVSVVMLSVGAGPLENSLARRMIRRTLALSDYVSVRDPGSARLLADIGWPKPVPVMPDLAFGLELESLARQVTAMPAPAQVPASGGAITVAINMMPVHDARYWPQSDPVIHRHYLRATEDLIAALLAQQCRVILFGTQPADEWVAEDTLARLSLSQDGRPRPTLEKIRDLPQLCELYTRCDAIVATRFHAILIAMRAARPVLGVCYYRKSRELLEGFGLGRCAVDIEHLAETPLIGPFNAMMADRAAISQAMREEVGRRRNVLQQQYSVALPASARRE